MREELKDVLQKYNKSQLAKSLGVSVATVSLYLAGKYKGDTDKLEKAILALLERQKEKAGRREIGFEYVETSVSKKIMEVLRLCHLESDIGVIYGQAGIGKTASVREYAKRNNDVILVEADLGYTAKVLFSELHRKLGYDGKGIIHDMFVDVIEKLKDSGRLIIIDEAEHLPYRALELLRRVHDKSGVGIVLVGMPRLLENLRGKKGEYAQLFSRVGVCASLGNISLEDVEMFVKQAIPSGNGIYKEYYKHCYGNTRMLTKLIKRSIRVADINGMQITPEIVKETAKMLIF